MFSQNLSQICHIVHTCPPPLSRTCPHAGNTTFVRQRHLSESDFTLYLILILSGKVQIILTHGFD